jgi:hypothetical protein
MNESELPASEWWWEISEEERDEWGGLSAAAARHLGLDCLAALWRAGAQTEVERRYIEDRITRVHRHLEAGTGLRRLRA